MLYSTADAIKDSRSAHPYPLWRGASILVKAPSQAQACRTRSFEELFPSLSKGHHSLPAMAKRRLHNTLVKNCQAEAHPKQRSIQPDSQTAGTQVSATQLKPAMGVSRIPSCLPNRKADKDHCDLQPSQISSTVTRRSSTTGFPTIYLSSGRQNITLPQGNASQCRILPKHHGGGYPSKTCARLWDIKCVDVMNQHFLQRTNPTEHLLFWRCGSSTKCVMPLFGGWTRTLRTCMVPGGRIGPDLPWNGVTSWMRSCCVSIITPLNIPVHLASVEPCLGAGRVWMFGVCRRFPLTFHSGSVTPTFGFGLPFAGDVQ